MKLNVTQIDTLTRAINKELQKKLQKKENLLKKDLNILNEINNYDILLKTQLPDYIYEMLFEYNDVKDRIMDIIINNRLEKERDFDFYGIKDEIILKLIDFEGPIEQLKTELINKFTNE